MSDSFSIRGKVGVVLEAEINIPDDWSELSDQEKHEVLAEQISDDVYDLDPDNPLIEEAFDTAEEMYNESAE